MGPIVHHFRLVTAALVFAFSTQAADLDELKSAQQKFADAFKAKDAGTLASLLAPGYIDFPVDGDLPVDWSAKTHQQRVQHFKNEFANYESWEVRLVDTQYRIAGAAGIVSGWERATRKPNNGVLEYPRWRFTATWIQSDGKWLLAAAHRSTTPATAPGSPALPDSPAEEKILQTAMAGPRWANVPMVDARLLRVLTEVAGAKQVVELGTSTGFSALWLCNALRKTGGHLTTFELDAQRAGIAREQFERAGISHLVTLVSGDAHENIKQLKAPIDVIFIDAEKDGYPDYLEKLLPLVRPGGIILAHNMRWPAPASCLCQGRHYEPSLETVFVSMDDQGLGITLKKR